MYKLLICSKTVCPLSIKIKSKGLNNSCKTKRKLYMTYKYSKDSKYKPKYLKYSQLLRKCITASQKHRNVNYITKTNNKAKAVWNIIKKSTSDDCVVKSIDKININNSYITDANRICTHFNNFFIDISNNNNFVYDITQNNINNLIQSNRESIFLGPLNFDELIKIVNSLTNTKSVGYDDIRTDIVKISINHIAIPLIHIINLTLEHGIFPTALKKSIVKPLHKKGDRSKMDNYRPVTLIPIFSKVLEKVMYQKLSNFIEKHNLLKEEQNGFRKNKSTTLAAFKLVKYVTDCLDKKTPIAIIFMDMSKAFDFVCHDILLDKLYRYGIRGPAHDWIKSYLCNRTQCVQISNYDNKSKTVKIFESSYSRNKFGVPQGSILGPLLFLLYINDLPSTIDHKCILFADDTTIVVEGKNKQSYERDINKALATAIEWLSVNNLKVNIDKTKLVQIHTKNSKTSLLKIAYNEKNIEEVKTIKFLGLILDNMCSWKQHVAQICSRLNSFVYPLRQIAQTVSKEAAITAYYGYITSILRYGIVIWGRCTDIDQAFIIQKRCIRAIFGIKQIDSCRPYFRHYNILTVTSLYILDACLFVLKNRDLFQQVSVKNYSCRSQHSNKLFRPPTRLTLTSNNSFIMCVKIYNKIPNNYKDMTFSRCKTYLTRWLTEKCFYSLSEFFDYKI